MESFKHEMVYLSMGKASRKKKKAGEVTKLGTAKAEDERIDLASKATPLNLIIIIVLFSLCVYFNALFNGFVYDDTTQLLENPWIRDIRYIPQIFSKSVWSFQEEPIISNYYRPLMHISYMLSYYIFGFNPVSFHLVNILFHAGVSVLVFLITSRLLGESKPSTSSLYLSPPFIAAMVFAAHPIHTEAVTWVAGLPDISFTFFYLLSFFFYLSSNAGKQVHKWRYSLSLVSFSLAALCKEPALTLPAMLIAYDYAFQRNKGNFSVHFRHYVPYFLIALVYLILRFHALGGFAPEKRHEYLSTYQYIINVFPLFSQYLEKLLFPVNLNNFYVLHPIVSILEMKGILSLTITMVFVILTFLAAKKKKVAFLGLCFVVIPLVPVLYIPGVGENTFAERYLYLPSVGFVILLAVLISWVRRNSARWTVGLTAVSLVVVGLYSLGTVYRNTVWKDDLVLFTDTVIKSQDGAVPHYSLGNAYSEKGLIDEAIQQYHIALKLKPDWARLRSNLGNAYVRQGLLDKAIEQYRISLKLIPDAAQVHYNLGNAYLGKRLTDEAIEQYHIALKLMPDYIEARDNLGSAYLEKGMIDEAIEQYQISLKLKPDGTQARDNLSLAYKRKRNR